MGDKMYMPVVYSKTLTDNAVVAEKIWNKKCGKRANDNLRAGYQYFEFVGNIVFNSSPKDYSKINNGRNSNNYHDSVKSDAFFEVVYKKVKHYTTGNGQEN